MDAQELRNLQEAYMEVVENQQLDEEEQSSMPPRRSAAERKKRAKELADRQTIRKIVSGHNKGRQPSRQEDPEKYYPKEQVDIYDIILSHLLDEGYAETPEAAEAIMVSMSEEWRDSIVEELIDERNRGEIDMTDQQVRQRRDRRDGDTTSGGYKPYVIAGGSQRSEHERNRGKKKTKSGYGRTQWQ